MSKAALSNNNFQFAYLLLLSCLCIFLWEAWQPIPQADDAYISYRYAINLVEGKGLVYNVGERVEGFTNLLWTLLIAVGIKLAWSAEDVGHFLGLTSGCGLLIATYLYALSILGQNRKWLAGIAPFVVLASNPFASWTMSALETPLFSALVVFALYAQVRSKIYWVVVMCALATLTRPEGVLLAATIFGFEFFERTRNDRTQLSVWGTWLPGILYASILLLLTLFRFWYYGDIVPNTFHAKVGGVPWIFGFHYIWNFLADGFVFLLLPLIFALRSKRLRVGLLYLLVTVVYLLIIGGDAFRDGRFLLPVLPIMVVASLYGVEWLLKRHRIVGGLAAFTLPLCMVWSLVGINSDALRHSADNIKPVLYSKRKKARNLLMPGENRTEQLVEKILHIQPPVELIASIGIGRLGFYSMLPILDLVGLVDSHIAHSKKKPLGLPVPGHQRSDAEYVFQRKPDLIFIDKLNSAPWTLPVTTALWNDARLIEQYQWDDELKAYLRINR